MQRQVPQQMLRPPGWCATPQIIQSRATCATTELLPAGVALVVDEDEGRQIGEAVMIQPTLVLPVDMVKAVVAATLRVIEPPGGSAHWKGERATDTTLVPSGRR